MDRAEQQFEGWFKDNYPMMYRLAYSLLEDSEDARDAVYQVFAKMWRRQPQVHQKALPQYLMMATRNHCLSILRQRKSQRMVEKEYSRQFSAQDQQGHEELMAELQRVIDDNLTEQDRRVLTLRYDEDMTYAQVAQALGISTSAVNKHVTGSLKKIRNILKITK
ncbi:MAG: RNA polymerase sigma factor [Bacteroidaceae bacterium]